MFDALLDRAAKAIAQSDALIIGAGAGMGVDSGLPDFRGNQGFWQAYPPFAKLGLQFAELANPHWFVHDPGLAWGFYGHRRNLYRATMPHEGYQILQQWGQQRFHGAFVFTSNVDAHFLKAGFPQERIWEVHGSLEWMQCLNSCGQPVFPAGSEALQVNEETMRAEEPFPRCPHCGKLARPNVLMFNDGHWDDIRGSQQRAACEEWIANVNHPVVIECGAGLGIPTVRNFCERAAARGQGTLIRINLREAEVPKGQIGLPLGALTALRAIDARLHG